MSKIQIQSRTWISSLHDLLSTGRHLLYASFVTCLKSNSCTALTTQYIAGKSFFNLHALNTTALQLKLFITGLVTSSGRSALPSANHSQGQRQTSQSLSAFDRRKGDPQCHSGTIPAPASAKPTFRMSSLWPDDYAYRDRSTQQRRKDKWTTDNVLSSVIVYSLSDHEIQVQICSAILPEHYETENIADVSHCPVGCSNLPHKVPGLQRLPFDVVRDNQLPYSYI